MANNLPTVLFVEDCDSDFELACLGLEQADKPFPNFFSSTNPLDAENARKCAANDYHVKPVVPDDFLRIVGRIVNRWLPFKQ